MTAPARATSPDAVLQQQFLVETCVHLALDPRTDLIEVLRENLTAGLGYTALKVHAVLLAAAWRDADMLNGHIVAVYERQVAAEQHDATTGHDVCCDGECTCTTVYRFDKSLRCEDCTVRPHALVDDAVRDLQWFLTVTVSERAARDMAGAA